MLVTPRQAPDDGDVALVAVAERPGRLGRAAAGGSTFAAYVPLWIAPWATPGTGRSGFHGCTAASPITKISGWPGIVRSGPTRTRPARSVSAPVARRDDPRRTTTPDARRPERGPGRDSFGRPSAIVDRHRSLVDVDDPGLRPDLDAEPLELALRGADRSGGYGGRIRSIASTRMIRASPGRIAPEVALERVVGDLAERARELDAGRPAADHDERHPFAASRRVGLALGGLEGDQDPAADLGRVLDRLEARRERGPVVVAEVRVARAGGDDQRVVGDRPAVGEQDLAALRVEPDRLAEQDRSCCAAGAGSSAAAARCRPGDRAPVATW